MRKVTIVDIAKEAGVSFKTVARVVNNEKGVGPKVRAEIQTLLDKHNFRLNTAARSLSATRSYTIALVVEHLSSHYYPNQIQIGAIQACRKAGYHLLLEERVDLGRFGKKKMRERVAALQLDGAILAFKVCDDEDFLSVLEGLKVPYVRITPETNLDRSPFVAIDDHRASHDMMKYLWSLGHREIAFIGFEMHPASAWRYEAYRDFLSERGATPTSDWARIPIQELKKSDHIDRAVRFLKENSTATAFYAASDFIAFLIMAGAAKLGLRVPEDISIVGFDDSPASDIVWPPLTTIHQPVIKMAEKAVELLIPNINGDAIKPEGGHMLSYRLVKRESAARVRSGQPNSV